MTPAARSTLTRISCITMVSRTWSHHWRTSIRAVASPMRYSICRRQLRGREVIALLDEPDMLLGAGQADPVEGHVRPQRERRPREPLDAIADVHSR